VKRQSRKPVSKRATQRGAVDQEPRTCPACGTKFFATANKEFCPVCILHRAFGAESKATGEAGSVSEFAASTEQADRGSQVRRFENYEVMLDAGGRPIELGRGAMGVTYKALDVDLRCPVTLKVISERYLGDESARLRFLREARAAARCAIRTSPRCYIWAEPGAVTFMRWSSWREKPLNTSSDALAGSK